MYWETTKKRFDESPTFKDVSWDDVYIPRKYDTFQQEMVDNEICTISQNQWNCAYTKANLYLNTDYGKSMLCNCSIPIGIPVYSPILLQHVLAMMLYCNFDTLQRKFTETFRKLSDNESDQQLVKRHRNYYWLGRYLRECVEYVPIAVSENLVCLREGIITLYHGVDKQFTFKSWNYMNGPFSTTRDYNVALNFCASEGIILEIKFRDISTVLNTINRATIPRPFDWCAYNSPGFDCQWLSDYPNEQEVFFIGGMMMRINNIIDVATKSNYAKYISAIQIISRGFRMEINNVPLTWDRNVDVEIQQIAYRLLSHVIWNLQPDHPKAIEYKSCPDYIKYMLQSLLADTRYVAFTACNKVQRKLFGDKHGWVDVEVLNILCPNLNSLAVVFNGTLQYVLQTVFQFLLDHPDSKLQQVTFQFEQYDVEDVWPFEMDKDEDFFQYWMLFEDIGWIFINNGLSKMMQKSYNVEKDFARIFGEQEIYNREKMRKYLYEHNTPTYYDYFCRSMSLLRSSASQQFVHHSS